LLVRVASHRALASLHNYYEGRGLLVRKGC